MIPFRSYIQPVLSIQPSRVKSDYGSQIYNILLNVDDDKDPY